MALARLGGRLLSAASPSSWPRDLAHFGDAPLATLTAGDVNGRVHPAAPALIALLVGPIAMATMVVGVGMHGFQGGWSFAPGRAAAQLVAPESRERLQALRLMQSGVETLKTLIAVDGHRLSGVARRRTRSSTEAPQLAWLSPLGAAVLGLGARRDAAVARGMGARRPRARRLRAAALPPARRSLKMTKQEVKDEAQDAARATPRSRARVRRVQREMARRRMLTTSRRRRSSSPTRRTSPWRSSTAASTMAAPIVLAKGAGPHGAAHPRRWRASTACPIVENKPLAQALYKTAEVGETIPGAAVRGGRRSARVPGSDQAADVVDMAMTTPVSESRQCICSRRPPSWRSCC